MKYRKLMANIFAQNDRNNAQVGFALVAGLAIGAALAVLFAPESGTNTRRTISDKAKNLGGDAKDVYASLRSRITGESTESETATENEQSASQPKVKKPKSDIKELIHEAHANGAQGDHNMS
jgi:gas vesicle protein